MPAPLAGIRASKVITAFVLALFLQSTARTGEESPKAPAQSEKPAADPNSEESPKNGKPPTARQERQIIEFARIHHPELADLLEKLKTADPAEYQRALADLRPARNRLVRLQERDSADFPRELALWKIESRIRLLLAQMVVEDDEKSLESSLRPLLAERRELKQQSLQAERERIADRLAKLDRQIELLQEPGETYTANEIKRLKQSLTRKRSAGKAKGKPARQKARDSGPKDAQAEKKSQKRSEKAEEKK